MKSKEYYLDDSATTCVWPEVVETMDKVFLEEYGNPSSLHKKGEEAMELIQRARERIAGKIKAKPWEIYFTSGGTESDNWAIQGIAKANKDKKKIIISAIEHAAVMESCDYMKKIGYEIVKIPVDKLGFINLERLEEEIEEDAKNVLLVSVIHANNIFGTVQDIEKIGEVCNRYGVLFHTDAVQSFGKLDIDVNKMNIDMLSASAHKIGGPKGVGLLYIREGVKIGSLIHGGGQEKNYRSGTENVPGIAGFAKALEIFDKRTNKRTIREMRDLLIGKLENIGGVVNGATGENRLYNNIHASFKGVENDSLVVFLSEKKIYVSAGSACDSKKEKEDYVLKALGLKEDLIRGSLRISLNSETEKKDIIYIASEIEKAIKKLRI